MALFKKAQEAPSRVYAAAADINDFDLLVEDLDASYAGIWEAVPLAALEDTLAAIDPTDVDLVIIAITAEDEENLEPFTDAVKRVKRLGYTVLLMVDEVSTRGVHALTRSGADDFAPYPLPEGVLVETINDVLKRAKAVAQRAESPATTEEKQGIVMPVYGVAGGVGATTFAVNLANEICDAVKKRGESVALLDLDLQYGTVSTALEMQRREAVYELLASPESMDRDSVDQALQFYRETLAVFTGPPESLPYEFIAPESVDALISILQSSYDYVIVDMPTALTPWSDVVLRRAETYFAVMELDMRSADNMLRFLRALQAEELPVDKVQFVVNRGPGFADGSKKSRMKRLAATLGVDLNIILPDGGKTVSDSGDHGQALAQSAPRNTLRKEIRKVANSLVELVASQKADNI